MSAEALIDLRADITRILDSKVSAERKDLQAKLDKLEGFAGSGRGRGRPHVSSGHPLKGRTVAPKYRGPNGETWTGRGLQPRWMSALVAEGRTPEEFAVAGGQGGAKKPEKKAVSTRKRRGRKAKV
jgi:DNA-binding protein H-NS